MLQHSAEHHSKVAVAMSGGVDSSVAALFLHEQGHEIIGISMQVWDYRGNGGCRSRATCCAPSDFADARNVAARIGVPYYVFDFEHTFRKEVIEAFVETYRRGMTPNPCVECNNKVKFRELRERVLSFGFGHVATGHYARIEKRGGFFHLLRGVDLDKDQSYFLYGLRPEELATTLFPIGELTKAEVRERARAAGLVTADKPESQDICFVSGSVQDFLVQLGAQRTRGPMLLRDGTKVGEHEGVHNFTVGQRRGLGVGGSAEPLYVTEIDARANTVFVGPRADLEREGFYVDQCSWLCPQILSAQKAGRRVEILATAQLRHRHAGVPVSLAIKENGQVSARFIDRWSTVSPGQAAVFYDADNVTVLGGGKITPERLQQSHSGIAASA